MQINGIGGDEGLDGLLKVHGSEQLGIASVTLDGQGPVHI